MAHDNDIYGNCLMQIVEILGEDVSSLSSEDGLRALTEKIKQLKEDDDMLNLAIDNSVDSFHITDSRGNVLRVNRAFEDVTKVRMEDVTGKNVSEIEREKIYWPSVVKLAIQEKRKLSIIQQGGGEFCVATANPVLDENGNVRIVVSNGRFVKDMLLLHDFFVGQGETNAEGRKSGVKILGSSLLMNKLFEKIEQIAVTDSSVLLTGETGVGKSLIAKRIHEKSRRSSGRFIEINCAAIPEALMESELFGYESGAFTGARKGGKPGLIEIANNGTLFLDEIGDMPVTLQAKLLQVLQNREIIRIGGEKMIPVNIRLISATNKDLLQLMEESRFREELYYRINVVPLYIPALRERKDDIPQMIWYFVKRFNQEYNRNTEISQEVIERLCDYNWPGNIRELENLIERLIVSNTSGLIRTDDLPAAVFRPGNSEQKMVHLNYIGPLSEALEEVEKQLVLGAYETHRSSYKVAELLKISQSGANRKIMKYRDDPKLNY
jgi:PAS domain S-box-containing protein